MSVYYSLAIQAEKKKEFLIKKATPLTPAEMSRLQSRACFDLLKAKAPKEMLSFEELDRKLSLASVDEERAVYLQKIEMPGLSRPITVRRSYGYFWKELICSTPSYIPVINVIWILLITPFLALYQFYKQDNGLNAQWESYLGRLQLSSYENYLNALSDFTRLIPEEQSGIKTGLRQALGRGEQIRNAGSSEALDQLATTYCTTALQGEAPFILPIGVSSEEGFTPLFLNITKQEGPETPGGIAEDRLLRIDVNAWGSHQTTPLERTYYLKQASEESRAALKEALFALMLPVISKERGEKRRLGGLRAHFKMYNLQHFQDANQAGSSGPAPKDVTDATRLHESLLLAGLKPAKEQQVVARGKLLPSFIEGCFPGLCTTSKIMLFLSLFQEGVAIYKEAFDSLTALQQREGFNLLENTLKKLKLHAGKFLKSKEEIDAFEAAFQSTFFQLKALEGQKKSHSTSSTTCKTETRITHFSEFAKQKQSEEVEVVVSSEMSELANVPSFDTITSAVDLERAITAVTKSNQAIDALIDRKEYARARMLALELMRRLPVVKVGNVGIFAHFQEKAIDALSEQTALVAKHFWESSLRLNIKTLEPPAVFQMIKLQALLVKLMRISSGNPLGTMTLDMNEIRHLLFFHPHQRWGLHPDEEKEWLPLIDYLFSDENQGTSTRFDTMINNNPHKWTHQVNFLKNNPVFKPIRRNGKEQLVPDQLIDLRRVQMMMTCLLKPDYCLSKYYDSGKFGQVKGLLWLDGMQEQAKREGATPEEMPQKVLEIKLRDVDKELSSMRRLELETDDFVTEVGPIVKIVGRGLFSGGGVAYLPTGYGLPYEMEERYATHKSEENSQELAGTPAEADQFLSDRDGQFVIRSDDLHFTGLSPAKGFTEKSHLLMQLQQEPKEQLSQLQRSLLSTLKIDERHYTSIHSGNRITTVIKDSQGIAPTSTFEALNLIGKQPHLLLLPPARQTLELVLSVPFALQRAIRENPHFFETYSQTLNHLIDRYWQEDELLCALLHLSQTIHDHLRCAAEVQGSDPYECFKEKALVASQQLKQMAVSYRTLASSHQIKEKRQTILEWLKERMRAPESNKGALSFVLVEYLRHAHKTGVFPVEEIPIVLFAVSVFKNLAAQFEMPQLAAHGVEWIDKLFKKELKTALASPLQRKQILNALTALIYQDYTFAGEWAQVNGNYTAGPYTFTPDSIELQSTGKTQSLLQILLPKTLKSHPALLQLFGSLPIYATVKRGKKSGVYHYTFERAGEQYRIDYDSSAGEVLILRFIDGVWARWFYDESELSFSSRSALDHLIQKNGLWVDVQNRKGWIFTHLPQAKDKGRMLTCKLTQEGELTNVRDFESGKYLVTEHGNKEDFQSQVPFWPSRHLLAFADAVGRKPSLFYLPATGDLLKGKQLSTKIFDGEVELLDDLSTEPVASHFLKTLGVLGTSIALAVKDSKGVFKFILQPYPLGREKGSLSPVRTLADDASLQLTAPLLIGFDSSGKVEGSPSSFLYLAYTYAHLKDYARAYYYLEKAQRAPRISAREINELDRVSTLIHALPSYSLQSSRFVLKAALAIHAVRRTHFGEMLYQDELSGAYFREVQFLTDTYRTYKKKTEQRETLKSSEEQMQALTAKEMEMLDSFEATSLREFSDFYKSKKDGEGLRKIDPLLELPLLQIDPAALKSPPILVLQSLVAFTNLEPLVPFDQIPHGFAPSAEILISHFFSLVNAIRGPHKKALAHYLLSRATWQMTPPATKQEAELAMVGEYLRQYLLLQFAQPYLATLVAHAMQGVREVRDLVPTFPRPKRMPFSMLFTLIDVVLTGRSFSVNRAIETLSRGLVAALPAEKIDPTLLFGSSLDIEEDKQEQSKSGHVTTPGTMLEYMKQQNNPNYLPLEVSVITELLEKEKTKHKDMNKEYTLFGVVEESQGRGYPVMGMRVFVENLKKIQELETALANPLPKPAKKAETPFVSQSYTLVTQPLKTLLEEMARPRAQEQAEFEQRKAKLEGFVAIAKRYFPLNKTGIEGQENQQLQKGIEEGQAELLKELSERTLFSKAEEEQFRDALTVQKSLIEAEYLKERGELLTLLKELPELRKMASAPDLYSEEELIERALHLYKRGRFEGELLDKQITQWLLLKTALQQIEKAKSSADVGKALQMLLALFDPMRYFTSSLHRKCLVAESLDRVILRPKQREALVKIDKDPHCWSSVRMGIGKTSYIMPIIADLLVEKGYFPILTVPSRSLARNRDSIGSATRRFFGQEDLEFLMPTQQNLSHSTLSEKYLHLLKVRAAGGYIVTSPEHLACLNEQITLHTRELLKQPSLANVQTLLFKIHYLQKIAQLIYGESRAGKSFFFGDEVDDTHHISNQINLAVGEKIKISLTIRETVKSFFELLITSKNPLRKVLESGTQAALLEKERDAALSDFAIEMKNSAFLKEKLRELYPLVHALPDQEWCAYLLNQTQALPSTWPSLDTPGVNPLFFETLGTLKMIFGTNAKQLFGLQPGNDIGFSNYQGYIAVPKQQKNEIQGMRHGNEYELVFTQYLCYYQMFYSLGTTDETLLFLKEELKKMKYEDPAAYGRLESAAAQAKQTDLLSYLLTPGAYAHRFIILERVFDQGYISRYSEQIEMSVQDLYQGTESGGVSGTLDPYTLPYISDKVLFSEGNGSTRQVEAETLLRLSLGHKEGLDTPIKVGSGIYEEPTVYLSALLANPKTKAIINASGVTAEGKDTLQWVRDLRKTHANRSYLFIHPKEQLPYLWTTQQAEPALLRDRKIPENCICIYAPSDTRGTDLPIGTGDVHLFLGPATSLQDMMQAIYRARQLGSTHTVFLHIAQQMAELIPLASKEARYITFGDVFNYIKMRTLQTKQSLNLKAEVRRTKGQLKGALLRYQRTPIAALDNPVNYNQLSLLLITPQFIARGNAFKQIEGLLVKSKKTDLLQAYTPQPKGSGLDRAKAAFVEVHKQIRTLRENLKTRGPMQSEVAFIAELKQLMQKIDVQLQGFEADQEKHRPYLPTFVDIPASDGDDSEGDQEQVIELQQEQALTQTNEIQKTPEMRAKMTQYLDNHFESSKLNTSMDTLSALPLLFHSHNYPIHLSLEAEKLHEAIPLFTDALFYIAVKNETLALITHYDYQELFMQKLPFEGQIYAPSSEGLREIYSGAAPAPNTPAMAYQKLLARLFLGDSAFTPEEQSSFLDTFRTLPDQEKQALHLFATTRGDHFLRTFGKEKLSKLL